MKTKTKLLIIMIIMLFLTILININVYATDESFTLSDDSLDIVLNGNKLLLLVNCETKISKNNQHKSKNQTEKSKNYHKKYNRNRNF